MKPKKSFKNLLILMVFTLTILSCSSGEVETIKSIDGSLIFNLSSGKKVSIDGIDSSFQVKDFLGDVNTLVDKEVIFRNSVKSDDVLVGDLYIIGLNLENKHKEKVVYKGFTDVKLGGFRGTGKVMAIEVKSLFEKRP